MKKVVKYGIGAVVLFGALSIFGGCGQDDAQKVSSTSSTSSTPSSSTTQATQSSTQSTSSQATNNLKVGDTVKTGNFEVTVNSARVWKGDDMNQPQHGKYVIVDVTVKNISDQPQTSSSMMMFKLQDKNGYSKDQAITSVQKGSVDGDIQPNGILRGEILYDVESNLNTFDFIVQGSLADSSSQATYKLSNLN